MKSAATNSFVIGVVCDDSVMYYMGEGVLDRKNARYSFDLDDAKLYPDPAQDELNEMDNDIKSLEVGATVKVLRVYRCPKCHKRFTHHPALSRKDNQTEICTACGVREAIEAYEAGEEGPWSENK